MGVLALLLISSLIVYAINGRLYTRSGKISKSTWGFSNKKQSIEAGVIPCALVCNLQNDSCNAFHFEETSNICSVTNLTLLEDISEDKAMFIYLEKEASKSLELVTPKTIEHDNFLLIGYGMMVQSYPCPFTLPVNIGSFDMGGVAVLDGKIYIYNFISNTCFNGNADSTGTWEEIPAFFTPAKRYPSMITVGQNIIISGGLNPSSVHMDTIERFNGAFWTTLTNKLNGKRSYHCSVAISNTEMVVLGGYNGSTLAKVEKYNVDGYLVETLESMPVARQRLGCSFYNDELYAAGGSLTSGETISDVDVYNMATKQWRKISNMNNVRQYPGLYAHKGKLIVFGWDLTVEEYDGVSWKFSNTGLSKSFRTGVSVPIPCPT
ncbi:kelch-like protein 20 [Eurytemora carolleeae]|uniref:kelch-like protein 20 n=1 Tax=Eurytemora carolleeae TaxID=1294199 RepID=UPI000C792AA6|nr:kelch-like protein 20 [Eurytemora carolleeae]|eukprot:XP_023348398.1 kelch-like protein 20 [Eurytemora affinis]